MIAFLEARKAGLFRRDEIWRNVVAGVVVGIVALPLAMAFAIASGAKPEQGLYTAIVAGLATSVLGGTRVQVSGPTGAFIAVLAGITAQYGIAGLQAATLMAGAMLLVMGVLKLGSVIRFIPNPVIVGFTSGIAVIIFVGQWQYFFGLPPVAADAHFHGKFWALVQALPALHPATTGIAVLALAIVVAGNRLLDRIPGLGRIPAPLVAMLAATAVQVAFQFPGVATIGTEFGGIPRTLPSLQWPEIGVSEVIQLVGPAFAIALLGAIESLLTAVVVDGMTGARHNPNQELIGQGVCEHAGARVRRLRGDRRDRAHGDERAQRRDEPARRHRARGASSCWSSCCSRRSPRTSRWPRSPPSSSSSPGRCATCATSGACSAARRARTGSCFS